MFHIGGHGVDFRIIGRVFVEEFLSTPIHSALSGRQSGPSPTISVFHVNFIIITQLSVIRKNFILRYNKDWCIYYLS
jgi:hypothetical protein